MKKVVHFELPYSDGKRANEFYEKVFGWEIEDASMDGMEYYKAHTGPIDDGCIPKEKGFINGGMMPKSDMVKGPVIAMEVDDIEESLMMVEENGGEKLMDPMPVGEMGHYAYVKDSEGSTIGVWQGNN